MRPRTSKLRLADLSIAVAIATSPNPVSAQDASPDRAAPAPPQLEFLYPAYKVDAARAQRDVAWIGESDYVVALHVASLAPEVGLDAIVQWRHGGASWDLITMRCHLDSQAYAVRLPMDVALRPPYGRACEYWRRNPTGNLILQDDEIRELALARVLGKYCGLDPGAILRERARGRDPRAIVAAHGHARPQEDTAPPRVWKPSQRKSTHHGRR